MHLVVQTSRSYRGWPGHTGKAGEYWSLRDTEFLSAGEMLAKLQEREGYDLKKTASITNDVLIALSARQIGATVITQNRKDFEAIRRSKHFDLLIM